MPCAVTWACEWRPRPGLALRAIEGDPDLGPEAWRVTDEERAAFADLADPEQRAGVVAARTLLRSWLAEVHGGDPLHQPLAVDSLGRRWWGRVGGEPPYVSVAHTGRWGVVAFSERVAVGVDVELRARPMRAGTQARAFADAELGWLAGAGPDVAGALHLWTRKEACGKAWGRGLGGWPRDVVVVPEGRGGPAAEQDVPEARVVGRVPGDAVLRCGSMAWRELVLAWAHEA